LFEEVEMDRENDIRIIAYHIWEAEGCPDGRDCEHWVQAELIWDVNNKKKTAPARTVSASRKKAAAAKKPTKSARK
jgi:hypothetical protein